MSLDLDSIAQRAQRQLDGMSINRDAFARDVLQLVDQLKAARLAAGPGAAPPVGDPQGSFADAFSDLFDDIFGRKGM